MGHGRPPTFATRYGVLEESLTGGAWDDYTSSDFEDLETAAAALPASLVPVHYQIENRAAAPIWIKFVAGGDGGAAADHCVRVDPGAVREWPCLGMTSRTISIYAAAAQTIVVHGYFVTAL